MTQFLADIAGMLELFAIAAGLVLLHRASRDDRAKLLKAAGGVLVAGGVVVGLCTSYFWFKYQSLGAFDSSLMGHPGMMHGLTAEPSMGSTPSGTQLQSSKPLRDKSQ